MSATMATRATTDIIVVNVEFSLETPAGVVVAIAPPYQYLPRHLVDFPLSLTTSL